MVVRCAVLAGCTFVLMLAALGGCSGTTPGDADPTPQSLEQALSDIGSAPVPAAVDAELYAMLQAELIRVLIDREAGKLAAEPPTGDWNQVKDLQLVEDPPGTFFIEWTYVNVGDSDLNSEVGVSDLTPIGMYFGGSIGDANWDDAQVADGDGNGEVGVSDITPVGFNFSNLLTEYRVYSCPTIEDHPVNSGGENGPSAGMLGIVGFDSSSVSAVRGTSSPRSRKFRYELSDPVVGDYYWVCPADRDAEEQSAASIAGGGDPAELPALALLNPPGSGLGTEESPYLAGPGTAYEFTLTDPLDGDVSSSPAAELIVSDQYAVSISDTALTLTIDYRYSGQFYVSAAYRGKPARPDSIVCFEAFGLPPSHDDWPVFGHDAQRTGRSPVTGPQSNHIAWDHDTGEAIYYSSPVVGADGTAYIGSGGFGDPCNLIAVKPDGSHDWAYFTNYSLEWSGATIGPDGTLYIGDFGNRLHAVNPISGEGSVLYRADSAFFGAPVVDAAGVIYACSGTDLLAISPDGTLAWTYTTGALVRSSPALSGDRLYIGSDDGKLHCVSTSGGGGWTYDTGYPVRSTPAVGADGAIYFTNDDYKLFAVESGGEERWVYPLATMAMSDHNLVKSSPALGQDGTVYVGVPREHSDTTRGSVHAVWPDGTQRWMKYIPGEVYASPALGADGTVYISTDDGLVYALDSDGNEKWNALLGVAMNSSPAIGPNGRLFVGCENGRLYCFGPQL